jgi:hypothetical protein
MIIRTKVVLSNHGYVKEKGQRSLWLNPKALPILGNVGIQLGTCKFPSNWVLSLGVVGSGLALCFCGTQGKGILYTYPSWRSPTHRFRVLSLAAYGNTMGEFSSWM